MAEAGFTGSSHVDPAVREPDPTRDPVELRETFTLAVADPESAAEATQTIVLCPSLSGTLTEYDPFDRVAATPLHATAITDGETVPATVTASALVTDRSAGVSMVIDASGGGVFSQRSVQPGEPGGSHCSPLPTSPIPSPQVETTAVKLRFTFDLRALSVPLSVAQPGAIFPLTRTRPVNRSQCGHAAVTTVPCFVRSSRARTAAQAFTIASSPPSRTTGSMSWLGSPVKMDGPCTRKRPAVQSGGGFAATGPGCPATRTTAIIGPMTRTPRFDTCDSSQPAPMCAIEATRRDCRAGRLEGQSDALRRAARQPSGASCSHRSYASTISTISAGALRGDLASKGGGRLDEGYERALSSGVPVSNVTFTGMTADEARAFAERWLPAWTGNDPERLASFYSEDVFYSDPAIPAGVRGRAAVIAYFRRLLARNPDWVWTHRGSIPLQDGFLNQWHASIPVGARVVEVDGVCSVQLRDGLIYANRVFFDRSELLRALAAIG